MSILANPLAKEVARVILKARYPNLVMVDENNNSLVAAAKNIRAELKATYPGVKFSVTSSRFSGGDSIYVRWTDGPNTAQVDPIVNKYKAGHFNGMEDIYEYNDSDWTDAFGDAKYVSTSRKYSEGLIASAIESVYAEYRANFERDGAEKPTVEQYKAGKLWMVKLSGLHINGGDSIENEINRRLHKLSRALPAKAAA